MGALISVSKDLRSFQGIPPMPFLLCRFLSDTVTTISAIGSRMHFASQVGELVDRIDSESIQIHR